MPLLLFHSLLKNMLHLQRVWRAQQSRRTQAEGPAFGVRCKRDAVALCVSVSKSWRHVGGHRLEGLLLFLRQIACSAGHAIGKRLHQWRQVVIEDCREVSVAISRQPSGESS